MCPERTRGCGGEGGIRTPDRLAPMPHFECGAFNHSATSPEGAKSGRCLSWSERCSRRGLFSRQGALPTNPPASCARVRERKREGKVGTAIRGNLFGGPSAVRLLAERGVEGSANGRTARRNLAKPDAPATRTRFKPYRSRLTGGGRRSDRHAISPRRHGGLDDSGCGSAPLTSRFAICDRPPRQGKRTFPGGEMGPNPSFSGRFCLALP